MKLTEAFVRQARRRGLEGTWPARSKTAEIELQIKADGSMTYIIGDGYSFTVGNAQLRTEKGKTTAC